MKVKITALTIAIVLLITLTIFLIFRPFDIVTRKPAGLNEKPVLLYKISGDKNNPFRQPMGLIVGPNQKLYVADTGNHQIKILNSSGKYLTSFGHKGAKPGEMEYPYGLAFLQNGHILVADTINLNVQEYDQTGKFIKIWLGRDKNIKPGAMATDNNGKVYISDLKNHQFVVANQKGNIEKRIDSKPEGLLYPQGLAIDKNGLIWVADAGHFNIKQVDGYGVIKNIINGINDSIPFNTVRGVAIDNLGRIFVSDPLSGAVTVFNEKRDALFSLTGNFAYPMGIYISNDGRIYILDRGSNQIQVWGYKK